MTYPVTDILHSKALAPQGAPLRQADAISIPERSLADCVIALGLFAGSCLYLRIFYNYATLFSDEGIVLQGAQRILQGQVLYRDFFSLVTPGSYYWMALLFRIFGSSILVARGALVIYGGLFSVLAYLIARRVCSRGVAVLAACLVTITCLPYYFMALHNWDSTLWGYLALYCAVRSLESRQWVWSALMGSFAAFTCLSEQSKGAGLVLGMGLGFICLSLCRRPPALFNRQRLVSLAAGFAWPFVATIAYFGAQHCLPEMLEDWLWPSRHYSAVNIASYGQTVLTMADIQRLLTASWPQRLVALFGLSPCFIIPALPILAVGVLGFGLIRLWRRQEPQDTAQHYVLVSATLVGLLLTTLATRRPDLIHIMFETPLFLLVLAWALGGRCLSQLLKTVRPLATVCTVVSFSAFGLALLSAPLSAHYTLRTRRGILRSAEPDAVLADLQTHVGPGKKVFVYPNQPLYYYLAATNNPTRHDPLFPGMSTPQQFEEALREVETDRTPIVLFEPAYIGRLPVSRSSMPVDALAARDMGAEYILGHYKVCRTMSSELQHASFVFMVRKDLSCAAPL